MTTRGRSRSIRSRRGPKPRYMWMDRQNAAETTVVAAGQALADLLGDVDPDNIRGVTVVRMILKIMIRSAAINSTFEWNQGVIPVTRDGFAAGAVPDPGVDQSAWYMQDAGSARSGANVSDGTQYQEYDIRTARRIVDRDTVLLHVITNNGGASLLFSLASRLLVRLP